MDLARPPLPGAELRGDHRPDRPRGDRRRDEDPELAEDGDRHRRRRAYLGAVGFCEATHESFFCQRLANTSWLDLWAQVTTLRAFGLVLGVLSQLGASANGFRIGRETLFGDPPETELGRVEAAWLDGATAAPAA